MTKLLLCASTKKQFSIINPLKLLRMKEKEGEEPVGIVGVVWHISGERLLLRPDYYRKKNKQKVPLSGQMFMVNLTDNAADYFVGDLIRVELSKVVNLTKEKQTCSFADLLTKEEQAMLAKNGGFLFNGFLEQVNIVGEVAALRFRVTSRINAEGKKLRVDKLVDYCSGELSLADGQIKNFLNNLFYIPLRKALTVRYSRAYNQESKEFFDCLSFVGIPPVQKAITFLKKNC